MCKGDPDIGLLERTESDASPAPWKVERGKHQGEDWLLASMGCGHDDEDYQVTTHRIRCSEMMTGGAEEDARFIVSARNEMPALLDCYKRMRAALEDIALTCPGRPAILARAGLGNARQLYLAANGSESSGPDKTP